MMTTTQVTFPDSGEAKALSKRGALLQEDSLRKSILDAIQGACASGEFAAVMRSSISIPEKTIRELEDLGYTVNFKKSALNEDIVYSFFWNI